MSSLLERAEQLEHELVPEPVAGPAMGALVLHLLLIGSMAYFGWIAGLFHSSVWGNQGAGESMQVTVVSNAIPLPNNQPLNKNVLATETPSPAPAPPSPKEEQAVDKNAIPIPGKLLKPKPENLPKTPKHPVPPPKEQNLARYGELNGTNIPRAVTPGPPSNQPVSVTNSDFGTRFGWYVEVIRRKVAQNWYRSVVDPHTSPGASVQIYFRVSRDGAPSNFRINVSSGSPTLDRSCLEATERVDTFGPLPSGSNDQWLDVTYNCTY
jgi:periplasmic protein TonB